MQAAAELSVHSGAETLREAALGKRVNALELRGKLAALREKYDALFPRSCRGRAALPDHEAAHHPALAQRPHRSGSVSGEGLTGPMGDPCGNAP